MGRVDLGLHVSNMQAFWFVFFFLQRPVIGRDGSLFY